MNKVVRPIDELESKEELLEHLTEAAKSCIGGEGE